MHKNNGRGKIVNRLKILAMMGILLLAVGVRGFEKIPCTEWYDVDMGLHFPSRIGDLTMRNRHVYGQNDYSLSYLFKDNGDERVGMLTFFLSSRKDCRLTEGVCPGVEKEMEDAVKAVCLRKDFTGISRRDVKDGRFSKSGLAYLWTTFSYKVNENSVSHVGFLLVTSFRGSFLKLRFTAPEDGKTSGRIPQFDEIVELLDGQLKQTMEARSVDIYSIVDPASRLEALRKRWAGVETRVTVWERPALRKQLRCLEEIQLWCLEKIDERLDTFEKISRTAIELRVDPGRWYYNLACTLALKKQHSRAMEALEKAVAAGFYDADHALKDGDLAGLSSDSRFKKLTEAMRKWKPPYYDDIAKEAEIKDGVLVLEEQNLLYNDKLNAFVCQMKKGSIPNGRALLVGNRNLAKDNEGLVPVLFPVATSEKSFDRWMPDFIAFDGGRHVPVFFANADNYRRGARNGAPTSVLGRMFLEKSSIPDYDYADIVSNGTVGILSCGDDYRPGGQDRLMAFSPMGLAYAGEDCAPFVKAAVAAFQAMPKNVLTNALEKGTFAETLLSVLQNNRWRPCLMKSDLDLEAIRRRAAGLKTALPLRPVFVAGDLLDPFVATTDVRKKALTDRERFATSFLLSFLACGGERTFRVKVRAELPEGTGAKSRLSWRLLQGQPEKIRIRPNADGSEAVLEIDDHEPFTVYLPNGTKVVSSRVDVGCFVDGPEGRSAPSVVSVFFSPNETREYDAAGRLHSIDYTKPQFADWLPPMCIRGNWKDVFTYAANGVLSGWVRTFWDEKGGETTRIFTRDGFEVLSRDEKNRPLDVLLNFQSSWMQELNAFVVTGREYTTEMAYRRNLVEDREGTADQATLVWRYSYSNQFDRIGQPFPKPSHPFRFEPGVYRRVDFSSSDFEKDFPILEHMTRLYTCRYLNYKCGRDIDIEDLLREDGRPALRKEGLTPSPKLKRMRFCPMPASSNGWPCSGMGRFRKHLLEGLHVQSDGGCRFHVKADGKGEEEERWVSLRGTFQLANYLCERYAFEELDASAVRCSKDSASTVFGPLLGGEEWRNCTILEGKRMPEFQELDRARPTFAAWRITENVYLAIYADYDTGFCTRRYIVARTAGKDSSGYMALDLFDEMPTATIGKTVLGAIQNEANALNNLAVLNYAGIANPHNYDEAEVKKLLMRSAEQGNVTAMRNLAILHENRGESEKAGRFLEAARLYEEENKR